MERAGAMRSLAAFYDAHLPDVFAICRMTPGDALAFATRFSLQWAYRGRQALFWTPEFTGARCEDPYLPFHLPRPLDRRALIRIDVERGVQTVTFAATEFARTQTQRAAEMRFVRGALRKMHSPAVFFAHVAAQYAKFADLGFEDVSGDPDVRERIYARGLRVERAVLVPEQRGIGPVTVAKLAKV